MADDHASLLEQVDFLDPDTIQCPFGFYEALRTEAPVFELPRSPIPDRRVLVVSKYRLIKEEVLPRWQIFSNRFGALMGRSSEDPEIQAILAKGYPGVETMLTQDPPLQRQYRTLVSPLFAPRRVAAMEEKIARIANDLIDRFETKGEADFLVEFSTPLPIYVIADALGVPPEDHGRVKTWANAAIAAISQMKGREAAIEGAKASVEMQHYLVDLIEQRRADPRDDVISALVGAEFNRERPLTISEMLSMLSQLMVAGHETTTNALGGGLAYILKEQGAAQRLLADPDLLANAVEEILRLEASTKGMWRIVTEDSEVGGFQVKAGDILFLSYDAGNRDEDIFPDGERCLFDRANARDHLSFGGGLHTCVGAQLARRQMHIAFELLLKRLPNLRLTPGKNEFHYLESLLHRGFTGLQISFDPVPR
jgi:cytochrome P450